ncbi:MAG TPA: hypothetical protein VL485_21455 [Ktedonobacteraceae bacterium]|nr:hypothetical protein [Ktedonobacteraceae bacterium]
MNIEPEAIALRLEAEFGYTRKRAEETARKLQTCAPAIQKAFEQWWRGQGFAEQLEAQGYTLQRLMDEHNFRPVGAFLTMDWIMREPDQALRALARGYDRVVISAETKAKFRQISEKYRRLEREGQQDTH